MCADFNVICREAHLVVKVTGGAGLLQQLLQHLLQQLLTGVLKSQTRDHQEPGGRLEEVLAMLQVQSFFLQSGAILGFALHVRMKVLGYYRDADGIHNVFVCFVPPKIAGAARLSD